MDEAIGSVESIRKRLRYKEARLNARWRLFTRRCPNVNDPRYISQRERYEEEARMWNLSLSRSGRNSTTRRFEHRWSFTGTMLPCSDCNAMMWYDEMATSRRSGLPRFNICCHYGQVQLDPLPAPPPLLDTLFNDRNFMENIRAYNSMMSFTSIGASIDHSVMDGRGPYTFRISGENYHQIGSLLPQEGQPPRFAQLYIYDTNFESRNRLHALNRNTSSIGVRLSIVENLQHMLDECNPYVHVFRNARDILNSGIVHDMHIRILRSRPGGQYIRPTADEIAALIVGGEDAEEVGGDIIVRKLDGILQRIYGTHPSYMALQYPLLFPYGTDGWGRGIPLARGSTSNSQGVTICQYYAFRIQFRLNEVNFLLRGGRLFLQFIVDCFTVIEQWRLHYVRKHQGQLRIEVYIGLHDAITIGETDASSIGRRCILPSSFTGGPRYMRRHFLDAMAICAQVGYPDFFITFTCNPNWPEIQEALQQQSGQHANNRPDIVARVFRLRLRELMRDFKERNIFGSVVADIYVIEFQKRGLPHAHILLTLAHEDKPSCAEEIDSFISAELPEQDLDPLAYATVTRHMIHGPCGPDTPHAPCMEGSYCSKGYPKSFCSESSIQENGFVKYRRRDDGRKIMVNGKELDNRWVVPYNRDLCVKYDAHINVERCAQKKVIKYLHKYMHKGPDRATFIIEENVEATEGGREPQYKEVDEIKQYLDGRYVSSIEAAWRIFEFEITHRYPSVEMLQFHLPGQHNVVFNENEDLNDVADRAQHSVSMLMAWFHVNHVDQAANCYTYAEFPKYYVWNRRAKEWTKRKKGVSVGRLPFAHPNSGERYYLRMLLTIVRGARSFEELRTIDGIEYATFREACIALGLVADNSEWDDALFEASTWATGAHLRSMFCSILMYNEVGQPQLLWENHWEDLSDDLQRRIQIEHGNLQLQLTVEQRQNLCLYELELILRKNSRSLKDYPPMPLPSADMVLQLRNRLIKEQLDYDISTEVENLNMMLQTLNSEQMDIFRAVVNADDSNNDGCIFVYGSGGTGKTYLWKTIIAALRSKGKIILSVASSGIAALLLPFGKTAHSMFKVPVNLTEATYCSFSKHSELAELIRKASLIIWDEAPMAHRFVLETVDRTLRDITDQPNVPFGGKLMLFGGDFRQILPVVAKGSRADIVAASLSRSNFWPHCHVMHLRINMRLRDPNLSTLECQRFRDFADWVLKIGTGSLQGISLHSESEPNWIEIPLEFLIPNDSQGVSKLISEIYPNLSTRYNDGSYMEERCILAPTNNDVDQLNLQMLAMLPGDSHTYLSSNTFYESGDHPDIDDINPPEILHGLNISGLPNHEITLKAGTPVVLLRNLDPSLGLCNGTRLIIEQLGQRVLKARIITGRNIGQKVLIPRIDLTPSTEDTPFAFKRRQFPIKLAFAMTINKSQGQTLNYVGIYLPKPVFCHGQLYVAVSRVTSPLGLRFLIVNKNNMPHNVTKNIVYTEVFNDIPTPPS